MALWKKDRGRGEPDARTLLDGGGSPAPGRSAELIAEPAAPDAKVPLVGARAHARGLQAENAELRARLAEATSHLERLGALTVAELEAERERLAATVVGQRAQIESERAAAATALDAELRSARAVDEQRRVDLSEEIAKLDAERVELGKSVVHTRDEQMLQEVGVYDFRHPLDDAVAFKLRLDEVKRATKEMARANGGAVTGTTDWTVNGSASEGRKMVREFSKLMLRAYNAEVDTLVRGLKPYKLDGAIDRLRKSRETIAKLGKTMHIEVSPAYHRLRVQELELTADYQAKVAEEKEHEREEKARLREERKAQQEMQRERERLEKERQHYANVLEALEAKGDDGAAAKLRDQLADVDRAIEDVDYRAANIRAGYVYVISNVGAFGERMIKVGMTRRLEPLDRVRELGDASVPFRFDVHALFFSEDAVGIEQAMHERLAAKRVNLVNLRREFFYATPEEARTHLLALAGDLLEYVEEPEAIEFRQSDTARVASTITNS